MNIITPKIVLEILNDVIQTRRTLGFPTDKKLDEAVYFIEKYGIFQEDIMVSKINLEQKYDKIVTEHAMLLYLAKMIISSVESHPDKNDYDKLASTLYCVPLLKYTVQLCENRHD